MHNISHLLRLNSRYRTPGPLPLEQRPTPDLIHFESKQDRQERRAHAAIARQKQRDKNRKEWQRRRGEAINRNDYATASNIATFLAEGHD